jgi:hypothetical protein
MEYKLLLDDKTLKPKEKTEILSRMILENPQVVDEFVRYAGTCKDKDKATCIEALEFATGKNPGIATKECFGFVSAALKAKAPRVKWESARVIGNTAHLYTDLLDTAIVNLMDNAADPGTVVRWSAATALGRIIKLKTKHNSELIPAIEAIMEHEENNSIRKIYFEALKKTGK